MNPQTQPSDLVAHMRSALGPGVAIGPPPPARWKSRVLAPALVVLAAAAALLFAAREALRPAVPVRVLPVVLIDRPGQAGVGPGGVTPAQATAAPLQAASIVQAPGWIEADPFPINVTALASGVVREVLVLEGERVEAEQTLVCLIDEDARLALVRAEADVAERRGELSSAAARLTAARTTWEHPFERTRALQAARAGFAEAVAGLARAEAARATERARAEEMHDELSRKSRLVESGAVSAGEVARLRYRIEAQEAAVRAAVAESQRFEAQRERMRAERAAAEQAAALRIEESQALAEAEGQVARAEANLKRAEAARDEAQLRFDRMEVRAPAAGVVMARLVEPGSQLVAGEGRSAVVARLYDPQRLQVRVDIPLVDAAKVLIGQRAEVTTEALPDRVLKGRVTRLVHEADIQKNTVQVKVAIDDPIPALRPEMLARVRIFAGAPEGGGNGRAASVGAGDVIGGVPIFQPVWAPAPAIGAQEGDAAHVWLVDGDGRRAARRLVRLGAGRKEGWLEVVEGLRPGDRLIISSRRELREGLRVRIVAEGGEPTPGEHAS